MRILCLSVCESHDRSVREYEGGWKGELVTRLGKCERGGALAMLVVSRGRGQGQGRR